jgi:hypothetical protein
MFSLLDESSELKPRLAPCTLLHGNMLWNADRDKIAQGSLFRVLIVEIHHFIKSPNCVNQVPEATQSLFHPFELSSSTFRFSWLQFCS